MVTSTKQATWGWRCKQCGEYMSKQQMYAHTHDQQNMVDVYVDGHYYARMSQQLINDNTTPNIAHIVDHDLNQDQKRNHDAHAFGRCGCPDC